MAACTYALSLAPMIRTYQSQRELWEAQQLVAWKSLVLEDAQGCRHKVSFRRGPVSKGGGGHFHHESQEIVRHRGVWGFAPGTHDESRDCAGGRTPNGPAKQGSCMTQVERGQQTRRVPIPFGIMQDEQSSVCKGSRHIYWPMLPQHLKRMPASSRART